MNGPENHDDGQLSRLSLNTATTKHWTLAQAIAGAVRAAIPALGVWRDRVGEVGAPTAAKMVADAGLRISSLCRGGFLTAQDGVATSAIIADNKAAIDEAAVLGTGELIMVVGGLLHGSRDIQGARGRIADRLFELAPYAADRSVRLVLEPLHPMYCADRAVLSTLAQALDLAAPFPPDVVGVVVDTFHTWWDPQLEHSIWRAGQEHRLAGYQVSDWNLPITADPLLSRRMMGDGYIDFRSIGAWITQAGFVGDIEVEIFNAEIWETDGDVVLKEVVRSHRQHVYPGLIAAANPGHS